MIGHYWKTDCQTGGRRSSWPRSGAFSIVCLAVLDRSASAGIAIALGYYVIELIAAPILTVTVSGQQLTDFLLRNIIDEWMETAFVSVEINGASSTANQPEPLQAFLVILAYTLVFCIAAFFVFLRRDIAGVKGE